MITGKMASTFTSCSRLLSLPSSLFLPRTRAVQRSISSSPASTRYSHALFCSSSPDAAATTTTSQPPEKPPAAAEDKDAGELAGLLDIRVGRVLKAWRHPEADSLYVEEVDVGEEQPRTICSGLVGYLTLEQLQDSEVIVLANLKPRNMRGIKSNGMLLAASNDSHETVELLSPPEGSVPGERVWFGSEDEKDSQPEPATPNQLQKKKIWESVQPHLRTSDSCIAVLGNHPMWTSAGAVFCKSLRGARVS